MILIYEKRSPISRNVANIGSCCQVRPSFIIVAEDVEGEALATLVVNTIRAS